MWRLACRVTTKGTPSKHPSQDHSETRGSECELAPINTFCFFFRLFWNRESGASHACDHIGPRRTTVVGKRWVEQEGGAASSSNHSEPARSSRFRHWLCGECAGPKLHDNREPSTLSCLSTSVYFCPISCIWSHLLILSCHPARKQSGQCMARGVWSSGVLPLSCISADPGRCPHPPIISLVQPFARSGWSLFPSPLSYFTLTIPTSHQNTDQNCYLPPQPGQPTTTTPTHFLETDLQL